MGLRKRKEVCGMTCRFRFRNQGDSEFYAFFDESGEFVFSPDGEPYYFFLEYGPITHNVYYGTFMNYRRELPETD